MAWVETGSRSFSARHEEADAGAAEAVLDDLERLRDRLENAFGSAPGEVSVVIHARPLALVLAAPWLPLARQFSAPAGRRYFAGWFASNEIHVLSPSAMDQRASGVAGSREALRRSARHEYAHLAIAAANPRLPPPFSPGRFRRYLALAWLAEGGATYLAGQVPHLRVAIARRMRDGRKPSFPPSARDAFVLGGTVFSLLESERGAEACVELIRRGGAAGDHVVLEEAFERPAASVQRTWQDHLAQLTTTTA